MTKLSGHTFKHERIASFDNSYRMMAYSDAQTVQYCMTINAVMLLWSSTKMYFKIIIVASASWSSYHTDHIPLTVHVMILNC